MATSIPPHNVGEICEALQHLIRHPNARPDTLMQMIPGPDFPTGGVLVEPIADRIVLWPVGPIGVQAWHAVAGAFEQGAVAKLGDHRVAGGKHIGKRHIRGPG